MVKCHEYIGTKATSWEPYGNRKEIAVYITKKENGMFLVERHNEYFNRKSSSWKSKEELKKALIRLDDITEKGLKYLGRDVEHCPKGFRKADTVATKSCVKESADSLYKFRR